MSGKQEWELAAELLQIGETPKALPRAPRERELEGEIGELHMIVRLQMRALHKEIDDRAKLIELLGEAKAHSTALRETRDKLAEEVRRLRSENEPEEEA
jgi:hypothetical protein